MMMAKTMFKLSAMPYAQAVVHMYPDGDAVLVSYTTAVAQVAADGWVYIGGLYSRTTARHIKEFIREYAPEMEETFQNDLYEQIKKMVKEGFAYNRFTGEIKDW